MKTDLRVQIGQQLAVADSAHNCPYHSEYDTISCPTQLEEANRTLTSDVANLANEKEELNNKLKEAVEGNSNVKSIKCYHKQNIVRVDIYHFCVSVFFFRI